MSARLADESGFTLVELLATLVISTIVLFALFSLVDSATRKQSVAVDRIESNDRARVAMDMIGTQLRSRVCISGAQGSLVSASASQIEFFASFGLTAESATQSQRLVLQRRRLTYRPAPNNDVVEESWVGASPAPALPPATTTTPTRTRTLLGNVALDGATPFFRYWALAGSPPQPTLPLAAPLSAADLTKVARIDVSFAAGGKVAGVSTPLQTQILDRSPGCFFG
jgi:prepilin-type N-terminal cleavage/methylation domain-containing protein